MTADVLKQGGYVVVATSGDEGAVQNHKGYAVGATAGGISSVKGAAVMANPAAVLAANTQVVIANPATVLASGTYVVFGNDPVAYGFAAPAYAVIHPFYPPFEDLVLDYSFMERRFPECVSFGSQGGPGFKTSVFTFDSGLTATEPEWDRIRARYEATFENVTPADVEEVEDFFYGMKGMAVGFRYKDWSDYVISSQNVAVGDGTSTHFQIFKRYESGGHVFDRIIKKTVAATSQVTLDGVPLLEGSDYFMLDAEGQVVFPTAPASGSIVKIEYVEFDVPVRFDTDYLNVAYDDFRQLNMTLPLIEVLV